MKDKIKFKELMAGMGVIFEKEITKTLADIYWKALEPFSDESCEMAFNRLISFCRFFPKPAEFLDILQGTDKDRAISAWDTVMACITEGIRPADEKINRAVKALGGWDNLERQSFDELKWTEKRFRENFETIEKRQELLEHQAVKQLQEA